MKIRAAERPDAQSWVLRTQRFLKKEIIIRIRLRRINIESTTDRLGSEAYNKKLSVKRAEAVKKYLVSTHSIDSSNVFVDGKGEANPVTGTTCKGKGKSLISCLQPDRRVEIEIAGVRQ